MLGLIDGKKLDLSKVKYFVLDECDKMLEALGIIRKIIIIYGFVCVFKKSLVKICAATFSASSRRRRMRSK